MNMIYYTYVLNSISHNKFYTGHTDNLKKRLREHNSGQGTYSNRYMPWEVTYSERFNTLEEAIKREKYFKSAAGRRWLHKNVNK